MDPENALMVPVGIMAGSLLFRTVLRWIATIASILHEQHEHRLGMVVAASIFNAGPWMLVAASVFGYFVHSKPWAPWLGIGVTIWGVLHALFAWRVLKIGGEKRAHETKSGTETSAAQLLERRLSRRTHVFRLAILSRLLNRPGADWIVAALAPVLVIVPMWADEILRGQRMGTDWLLIGIAVYCALFGFWGVRTWRRLWRAGRTFPERAVYDYGVRGAGPIMLLVMAFAPAFLVLFAGPGMGGSWDLSVVFFVYWMAVPVSFVALPLSLWFGYAMGYMSLGFLPRDSWDHLGDSPGDLPPPVQ